MRKLPVICLFFIFGNASGQSSKVEVGIEAGPGLSSLRGNELVKKHHSKISYSAGVFFQYNLTQLIAIRTSISYERKGSATTQPVTDNNGNPLGNLTVHSNFNYLTLPLLIRATFGNKINYFINAGPYFSYLLKQTQVGHGDNFPRTTTDNTPNDKRFDMGISAGIGLQVPIKGTIALSCEVRNNLGLYNVSAVPVYNDGSIKTNITSLLLGFSYRLGKHK